MATTNRRYQGYPYVDPPITDVPSISADAAARWQHLPRRQIELPVRRNAPTDSADFPARSIDPLPAKNESNEAPVVYIDLPEASSSIVARRCSEDHDFEVVESPNSRTNDKTDPDVPMVYIDLPEAEGSDVATSWGNTPQEEEPTFVQETIFYDPFENRRIDHSKPARDESDDESEISSPSPRRPFQMPARRPNHLDLNEAGTSAGPSSYASPSLPPLMSKEANIYGQEDRFPTSPIPVSQFPQPPPAYSLIDALSSPVVEPVVEPPRPASPPKTQVILPQESSPSTPMPIGIPHPDRKYLSCHHCGMRVHTLVIKETGKVTHVTALACCMIACLPAIFFIYCTDYLKVKKHYCPNCNQSIGYQQPMSGDKIFYVN